MWIRKFHKDDEEDTRSPIPTQVVSNEEYVPRPQTLQQKKVESLIQSLAEKCSKKIGLTRRDFLKTTNGMAVAFIAMNEVFGKYFNVQAEEMIDPDAIKELWPKSKIPSKLIMLRLVKKNHWVLESWLGPSMKN